MLLLMFLMAACDSMPKFPKNEIRIYFVDVTFQKCVEFEVVDTENFQIEATGNVFEIEHCHLAFGMLPKSQTLFNDWLRDVKEWGEDRCD